MLLWFVIYALVIAGVGWFLMWLVRRSAPDFEPVARYFIGLVVIILVILLLIHLLRSFGGGLPGV